MTKSGDRATIFLAPIEQLVFSTGTFLPTFYMERKYNKLNVPNFDNISQENSDTKDHYTIFIYA